MSRLRAFVVAVAVCATTFAVASPAFADALLPQTIDFTQPDGGQVGTTEDLSATAPGGQVTFTIDPTTDNFGTDLQACTIEDGSTASYDHVGTCVIDANQPGDGLVYDAAPQAQRSATVSQATATVSFVRMPSSGPVGTTEPLTVSSTADVDLVFSVDPTTDNFGAPRQACSFPSSVGLVSYDHTGTCVVDVTTTETADYASASATSDPITITKGDQTLSATDPLGSLTVGDSTTYTAPDDYSSDSGLTPVPSLDDPSTTVCSFTKSDGQFTVTGLNGGSCVVDIDQPGDNDYNKATQVQLTFPIDKAQQHVDSGIDLNKPLPVGQTFTLPAKTEEQQTITWSTTNGNCTISNTTTLTLVHTGMCELDAQADATSAYAARSGLEESFTISKGASTVSGVKTTSTTITANVAQKAGTGAVLNGAKVTFTVGGSSIGSATVTNGVATLTYHVPTGATRQINATYAGSSDLTTSSGSYTRRDPMIVATITSAAPKSSYGWYRKPVTASFKCTVGTSAFVKACPAAQTFSYNGTQRRVFGRVDAVDGGGAFALTYVNVDHVAPTVSVSGPANGATYVGTAPKATCVGKDDLSGIASCTLRLETRANGVFSYAASAVDKAGNVSRTTGTYRVMNRYIRGVTFDGSSNSYLVTAGSQVTLVALAATRPTYLGPVFYNGTPHVAGHTFYHDGRQANSPRWALTVTLPTSMRGHAYWNLGIKVGTTVYKVKVRVTG